MRFNAGLLHRFHLDGGTITHNGEQRWVHGAHADITTGGFALTRRSYLTITGRGFAWTARIDSATMGMATRFAANVNAAAAMAEQQYNPDGSRRA